MASSAVRRYIIVAVHMTLTAITYGMTLSQREKGMINTGTGPGKTCGGVTFDTVFRITGLDMIGLGS
jgi:hypothetical protein